MFDFFYELRKVLKAQLFTDFIAKMTPDVPEPAHTWVLFRARSSNNKGNEDSLILDNEV